MNTLVCTKCGVEKPIEEFARKASNMHRQGRQNWCRDCNKEYIAGYLSDPARREVAAKRTAEWVKSNPERAKALQRARRETPERLAHDNAVRTAWKRKDRAANPEKYAKAARDRYRGLSPAKKQLGASRSRFKRLGVVTLPFSDEAFLAKWEFWDNRCWICRTDKRLETDHVKPVNRGGWNAVCNFRPICRSCNPAKGNRWPFPLDPAEARAAIGVALVDEGDLDGKRASVVVKKRVDGVPVVAVSRVG